MWETDASSSSCHVLRGVEGLQGTQVVSGGWFWVSDTLGLFVCRDGRWQGSGEKLAPVGWCQKKRPRTHKNLDFSEGFDSFPILLLGKLARFRVGG